MKRSTISWAGSAPMPGSCTPATPSIRRRTKFYGDVQERLTAASTHLLFFSLELNRIDDALLEAAMADPALGHYRPWLEDVRRYRPYQLEDRVEQLFHEKSMTAYSRLEPAVRRHHRQSALQGSGQVARHRADAQSACRTVPAQSAKPPREALARTFKDNVQQFRADHQHARQGQGNLRPLARLCRHCRRPPSVEPGRARSGRCAGRRRARRLSAAVAPLLRAQGAMVRQEELPHWDRNAPLPQVPTRTVGWIEARETVLTAYGAFSPKMAAIAERFFAERWIDAPVRPGKSPGAFAHPTMPSAHPYVLLNYQGKPRDVMTLAHELGHGVHQVLAAPNGALMAPTPLTLAETASVFGEMLTFRKLLAATRDKKERKAMLAAKVEDMINTVVRQIAFYTFERAVHTERKSGELTAERIGELWLEVQRESLGPGDRAQTRLRDVLGLHSAFHPLAVLCLRLRVRRLPGEFALRGLRARRRRLCRTLSRHARGRRHQAPLRAARPFRPRRARSRRSGRAAWASSSG